jgi:hypothetical protein
MQLNRTRGDTSADVITVSYNTLPVDLAGCTAVMTLNTLRNPVDTTSQIYQVPGVISLFDSSISFSPTAEQANQVGFFYYDIQLTEANGAVRTLVKDAYNYVQDITK